VPAPDADRNLLFAVLALQADCLTQSRFVEACTLWASSKETPLPALLVERGWLTADERADIDRLLTRKLQKHAGDARAGLREVSNDHVRQSLAGLPDPDVQASLASPPPAAHILLSTSAELPNEGERYTITRLHATGGIGRVWLARDSSLDRDVALKELRPERAANPAVWDRFLREARVTGQLEHPGIVPIYELGRRPSDNQPFYTMRFVRGQTLREAVAAYHQKRERNALGPLDLRDLLTAFVGVCNAVAYAHSRGVIHRDLKPANVVLGQFGEVMVLDWGLAREMRTADRGPRNEEQQTTDLASAPSAEPRESHPSGTLEGQVLGTPAYMAPEQADGRLADIDARTDVYGLGAVLYELLAGRPPFTGENTEQVLSRVRTMAPDRPRDVVPATPRALEAICLKALEKKSADRYPSAEAVKQDVQRFLADEPVSAYREPVAARAARWAKRHRTLVTSLVAVLAVAVPILLAAVVLLNQSEGRERAARRQEESARIDAQAAREQEQLAREKAQANYHRSLRAADALSEEFARGIRPIAGTQAKTVITVLDRAKSISDDLLADPDAPPEALERRAKLLIQFAELYRETNRSGSGRQAVTEALAIYDRLLAASPRDRALRVGRARANHRLGWILMDQGYEDESVARLRACIAELEEVGVADDPLLAAVVLGSAYTLVGNLLVGFGDHDGAEPLYRRGLELRRRAMVDSKGHPAVRAQLAIGLERTALFRARYRPTEEWRPLFREARAELEALCAADPWDAAAHLHLVRLRTSMAQEAKDADADEATALLDANAAVVDRFARRDPDHLIWHREETRLQFYRNAQKMKSVLFLDPPVQDELRSAQHRLLEELTANADRVGDQDPENYLWLADAANYRGRLADSHVRLAGARLFDAPGHLAAARAAAHDSVRLYERILARSPGNVDNEIGLLYALSKLPAAQTEPAGYWAARFEHAARELPLYHRLGAKFPTNRYWAGQLLLAYYRAGAPLRAAATEPDWAVLARPEVIAPLIRLAATLADPPPGLPSEFRPKSAAPRANAAKLLRDLDAKGLLPPEGKAVLAKLEATK
jgi:tRNA A-37 threonylcarbamoyl transferase component Bud32